MKNVTALLITICFYSGLFSQTPQGISYQAVARKSNGDLIKSHSVSLRFSIHDSIANGTIVYQETQNTTTNPLGLFSVNIGQGNPVTGIFNSINWGNNTKFLQVELDLFEGSDFIDMGTQQMMSVPYALYAKQAETILTVQERLNKGETPIHIYQSGISLNFLYGKFYQGGLLGYLNVNTGHGFVYSPDDLCSSCKWVNIDLNPNPYPDPSSFDSYIGSGQSNTNKILAAFGGQSNYAAYQCDVLELNGYNDWYLPSILELWEVVKNGQLITNNFEQIGYWSSTEDHNPVSYIFGNTVNGGIDTRFWTSEWRVRAIRSF